jgi:hypothetical protein
MVCVHLSGCTAYVGTQCSEIAPSAVNSSLGFFVNRLTRSRIARWFLFKPKIQIGENFEGRYKEKC